MNISPMKNLPTLIYKLKEQQPIHRLPFVGGHSPSLYGVSFWNVPDTGGYAGGCKTGSTLALLYLKHLREHGAAGGGALQNIVLDMLKPCSLDDSTKGQIVGFFSQLDPWLGAAAKNAGARLDSLTFEQLMQDANDGLNEKPTTFTNEG